MLEYLKLSMMRIYNKLQIGKHWKSLTRITMDNSWSLSWLALQFSMVHPIGNYTSFGFTLTCFRISWLAPLRIRLRFVEVSGSPWSASLRIIVCFVKFRSCLGGRRLRRRPRLYRLAQFPVRSSLACNLSLFLSLSLSILFYSCLPSTLLQPSPSPLAVD